MAKTGSKTTIEKAQTSIQEKTVPKKVRNYRAVVFQGYLIVAIVSFAILAALAKIFPYFTFDLTLARGWQSITLPGLLPFMELVSFVGYDPVMPITVATILFILVILGLRWEALVGLINISVATVVTLVFKTLIGRGRPPQELVNVVTNLHDKSFPSGHVLTYTAFFGFLFFLAFTLIKPSLLRIVFIIIFGNLIILVGPSRVYLGEHWPSDTIGAYLMGSIILLLTIYFYRWGKTKFFTQQPVAPEKPQ